MKKYSPLKNRLWALAALSLSLLISACNNKKNTYTKEYETIDYDSSGKELERFNDFGRIIERCYNGVVYVVFFENGNETRTAWGSVKYKSDGTVMLCKSATREVKR
jgi:hypothetical protein